MPPRIACFQSILPLGAGRPAAARRAAPLLAALALAACGGAGPFAGDGADAAPAPAEARAGGLAARSSAATAAPEPFSVERAWAHLVALSDLGPRPSGTPAAHEALEYIRTRLEELGLETIDIEVTDDPPAADEEGAGADAAEPAVLYHHLAARVPGDSPDSILLAAHYDTRPQTPGANDGASGPAVLLELARQLVERPLPYTVELVFLDGAMAPPPPGSPAAKADPERPGLGGPETMAGYLVQADTIDVVRLAVVLRQVCDADLTIGRDLHSSRMERETFFDVAERLGLANAFPRGTGYVESWSSHRPFIDAGLRNTVLLHDNWYGGDETPGPHWGGEHDVRDHCAPQSLHAVGVVTLGALREISQRLAKIDRLTGRAERRRAESEGLGEAATLESESVEEAPDAAVADESAEPAMDAGPESAPEMPADEAPGTETMEEGGGAPEAPSPAEEASAAPPESS